MCGSLCFSADFLDIQRFIEQALSGIKTAEEKLKEAREVCTHMRGDCFFLAFEDWGEGGGSIYFPPPPHPPLFFPPHQFHFSGQDQSTESRLSKKTVTECFLTSCE